MKKLNKIGAVLMLSLISALSLTGCKADNGTKSITELKAQNKDGITTIYFKDMVSMDAIRKLDGQKVKVVGFMAQTTPLDGSLTYLMNLPYQNCAFCVPNSDILGNTIAVFPKEGSSFKFTELPVSATGVLKVEDYTDSSGYSYPFRLVDSKLEVAEDGDLPENAVIFKTIVDKGFLIDYSDLLGTLDTVTLNGDTSESAKISNDIMDKLYNHLEEYKYTKEVESLYTTLEKTQDLIDNINKAIDNKDSASLTSYNTDVYAIFSQINEWLLSVEI